MHESVKYIVYQRNYSQIWISSIERDLAYQQLDMLNQCVYIWEQTLRLYNVIYDTYSRLDDPLEMLLRLYRKKGNVGEGGQTLPITYHHLRYVYIFYLDVWGLVSKRLRETSAFLNFTVTGKFIPQTYFYRKSFICSGHLHYLILPRTSICL